MGRLACTCAKTMNRRSILAELALLAFAAASIGCQRRAGVGPAFATAPELPPPAQRPDGITFDPAAQWPPAADTATTHTPVAVLQPPLPDKAVAAVLSAFFRSIVDNDTRAMANLLTDDAIAATGSGGSVSPLLDAWRARMRRFSYRKLAGQAVYDPTAVEVYRYADLADGQPGQPARPPAMTPSDLLARVPMAAPQIGSDRLFGDQIVFLLRPADGRLQIRAASEDFRLP
jgi:hypothetical protein